MYNNCVFAMLTHKQSSDLTRNKTPKLAEQHKNMRIKFSPNFRIELSFCFLLERLMTLKEREKKYIFVEYL